MDTSRHLLTSYSRGLHSRAASHKEGFGWADVLAEPRCTGTLVYNHSRSWPPNEKPCYHYYYDNSCGFPSN